MAGDRARRPGRAGAAPDGHSLPELIVAVAFLAATVAAVGGTAVLGGRLASRAVVVEEAVRTAERVLDSLSLTPGSGPGSLETRGLRVSWRQLGNGALRVVVSRSADGRRVVVLDGFTIPQGPVIPDQGAAAVPPPPSGPVVP